MVSSEQIYGMKLYSKNGKKTGIYLYGFVLLIHGKYHYGTGPIYNKPQKKTTIDLTQIKVGREILPPFYKANGIITPTYKESNGK